MGCDIHIAVERFDPGFGSRWCFVGEMGEDGPTVEWGDDRNYVKFTLLAGIRDVGSVESMFGEPKGLPSDMSAQVLGWVSSWGADGHSHSWLSIKEVMTADWSVVLEKYPAPEYGNPMTRAKAVGDFWTEVVPIMLREKMNGAYDVRVVFFFDN